jgi:hypothetical protein
MNTVLDKARPLVYHLHGQGITKEGAISPTSVASPYRTLVQIIDGNNDKVTFDNKTLRLDPKYGEVILAADPNNGDILGIPLSYNTLLSWNLEQAKSAMNHTAGNLLNVKEVSAGTDPYDIAFDVDDDKIYITNYRLNAILVDELKKYETVTLNNSQLTVLCLIESKKLVFLN